MRDNLLNGKRVLVVDDEPDIFNTVEDLLPMCRVTKAQTFESGKQLLESERFDIAVLDIMDVNGYALLEIAKARGVIPVMLTARALSLDDTARSYKQGAAAYIPKEEMAQIELYLNDVLELYDVGKSPWARWYDRFVNYYNRKFGQDWQAYSRELLEIYHLKDDSNKAE